MIFLEDRLYAAKYSLARPRGRVRPGARAARGPRLPRRRPRPRVRGPRRGGQRRHAPVRPGEVARPRGMRGRRRIRRPAARRGPLLAGADARAGRAEVLLRDRLPPRLRRRGRRGARPGDPRRHGAHLVRPEHDRVVPGRRTARAQPPERVPRWTTPAAAMPPPPRRPRRGKRRTAGSSTPLDRALRPGESYSTTFAFHVSTGARGLRLFIGNTGGPEALLIGHENSPLHGKVYFALPAPRTAEQ